MLTRAREEEKYTYEEYVSAIHFQTFAKIDDFERIKKQYRYG